MIDFNIGQKFNRMEQNVPLLTRIKHVVRKAITDTGRVKEVERVAGDGKWTELAAERSTGKRALFVTPRFWPIHVGWELTFAWLAARDGFSPHFITCGGITPMCDAYRREHHVGLFCNRCQDSMCRMFEAGRIPYSDMAHYIDCERVKRDALSQTSEMTLDDIVHYTLDGAPVGEWIIAPLARHLRSDLNDSPYTLEAARLFLAGALAIYQAAEKVLDEQWDMLFMACGKFLHERIFYELARKRGIDVFIYERGYLPDTLVMSTNDFVDLKEDRSWLVDLEPTNDELEKADRYLMARRKGDLGLISHLWPEIEDNTEAIRTELNLPAGRQVTLLCSNIVWDTAAVGRDIAFDGLVDWVCHCIDCFRERTDSVLVIRVHPGEARSKSQETLARLDDLIAQRYPDLPDSVRVVPPESLISTYALIEIADRVVVYSTTVGLEAARFGKQVLVCGQTNYRGKGFTVDIESADQLEKLLAEPARNLTSAEIEICRKYAWHFFYNLQIPFPLLHEYSPGAFRYTFDKVEDLFSDDNKFANYFSTELERRPHRFLVHR